MAINDGKTSTFTVHHDRCKPDEWTARDVLKFANFLRHGDLRYAAELSRLGMQLVLSEHHVPVGGTLQEVGFASASGKGPICDEGVSDDLSEVADDDDVVAVARIYRGPTEYAARIPMGDGDGNFDGFDYVLKPTEAEARAYFDSAEETAETENAPTPTAMER